MKKLLLARVASTIIVLALLASCASGGGGSGIDAASIGADAQPAAQASALARAIPAADLETYAIPFRAKFAESDTDQYPCYADVDIRWGWEMFAGSAMEYSNDLAIAAMALSAAAENTSAKTEKTLEILGFDKDKMKSHDYYTSIYDVHKVAHTFAYRRVTINQKECNVFAIINRGTHDTSDFLTDGLAFIGAFEIASVYTLSHFADYMTDVTGMSRDSLQSERNIFFITGHSLGGSVANLLARILVGYAPPEKIFAYTFAAPRPVNICARNSGNIFNIINTEDNVPKLPPFYPGRAGIEIFFSSADKSIDGMEHWFTALSGGHRLYKTADRDPATRPPDGIPHSAAIYMAYLLAQR